MRLNRTQEYLELVVNILADKGLSPCQCDDLDEYEDLVFDAAEKAYGPPNASQRSILKRWVREDWEQDMIEIDRDNGTK
jgi:hypothetical protein